MMMFGMIVGALLQVAGAVQGPLPEENIGPSLLTAERIAALPAAERSAWMKYIARSEQLRALDTATMNAELYRVGRETMTRAPYSAPDFPYGNRSDAWLRSDSAGSIAQAVLTFQTPSGGWSKRTDMTQPRERGMSFYSETSTWHYIPTFDNGATTGQLRLLGRLSALAGQQNYAGAFARGLALVFDAQMPSGCWPQSFPLDGGYHDAATFNDNADVLILRFLEDAVSGVAGNAAPDVKSRARDAIDRGRACLIASQVRMNGVLTVWGQQGDPLTLAVVRARMYELPGLSGRESAGIMSYLMSLPNPDKSIVTAVHAAARWFAAHEMSGVSYDPKNGVHIDANHPRVWARLTDLETDKPIFANRDGKKLYDWTLLTDRRVGYAWFTSEPLDALNEYQSWSKLHPEKS